MTDPLWAHASHALWEDKHWGPRIQAWHRLHQESLSRIVDVLDKHRDKPVLIQLQKLQEYLEWKAEDGRDGRLKCMLDQMDALSVSLRVRTGCDLPVGDALFRHLLGHAERVLEPRRPLPPLQRFRGWWLRHQHPDKLHALALAGLAEPENTEETEEKFRLATA